MEPLESNAPNHTRFFDIITIPPPPSQDQESHPEHDLQTFLNSFNSIMYYEDAILDAIRDLRDGHSGSNIHAIKRHIHANFFHVNMPHLHEQETEILLLSLDMLPQWKEHLFVQALKSLVEKNCIEYSPCGVQNGSCLYKLSHHYKKHRAEELRQRMERLNQYKLHQEEKRRQILRNATSSRLQKNKSSSNTTTTTTTSPVVHKQQPSILKKGHLVESQTVMIVASPARKDGSHHHYSGGGGGGGGRRNSMDLDREKQIEKRSALPHTLGGLHADEDTSFIGGGSGGKKKGLRDQCKIPHGKIYVKKM